MTRVGGTSPVLSVTKSGTGSGTVTSSPAGINCGSTCSGSFSGSVTLTATPADGSTFAGWSGACAGTGICTVTMDAAKSVSATFNRAPFVVTTTGVTAGLITEPIATVTTTITFNPTDVGKTGAVYVTAWVPVSGLGALGISVAASSQLSVTSTTEDPSLVSAGHALHVTQGPLVELAAGTNVLVQSTSSGWQLVVNGQLIPYASGVLGDQLAAQTVLNNTNTANLAGGQFCLGYGTSASQMAATGNIQLIGTIPDPNSTGAATGTCLVVALPNRDLNGDGKTDILWYNASTGTTSAWLMNGTSIVGGGVLLTDPAWKVVGTGDFNGDGKTDILWYNAGTGTTSAWLMNGTSIVGGGDLLTDPAWKVIGTGDFNGDGKTDILWYNAGTGTTSAWLMNGTSIVGGGVLLTDPAWKVVGTGDFNGDGKTDILWYNAGTGSTSAWLMNGTSIVGGGVLLTDPAWKVVGTGDFNGDGKTDILWYRRRHGNDLGVADERHQHRGRR